MYPKLLSVVAATDDKSFIEAVLTAHAVWLRHTRRSAWTARPSVLAILASLVRARQGIASIVNLDKVEDR